jgi:hypothetical protein
MPAQFLLHVGIFHAPAQAVGLLKLLELLEPYVPFAKHIERLPTRGLVFLTDLYVQLNQPVVKLLLPDQPFVHAIYFLKALCDIAANPHLNLFPNVVQDIEFGFLLHVRHLLMLLVSQ